MGGTLPDPHPASQVPHPKRRSVLAGYGRAELGTVGSATPPTVVSIDCLVLAPLS